MAGSNNSVDILGCRLDRLTRSECRAWVEAALSDPWDGRCRHIVTLNPEYVMAACRDPAFATALRSGDLVTPDGVGVAIAARWIGGMPVERVTGVELTEWLAELSSETGSPLFLLGAAEGVADAAAERLKSRFPSMRLAGTWSAGTPQPDHDRPAIERIAASGARIVAVAYGAPGQIHWIARNQEALAASGVRIAIGVGGALDYLSGTVARPPALIRRFGLEWLVRLVNEPRRWRRQLVLPVFAGLAAKQAIVQRISRRDR